ncbi:MAG: RagB/SusD family nutrient uptake outer membrane protein [Saprospirales bacterium]|nr:RagB/SusD family nutrient uptake outer membrane protein [Saprospirales bacterium]
MKKIMIHKNILFFILTLLMWVGCSKDFLDRKPLGELTYDTFFETEDHAVWATNAVYQQFRTWECIGFSWIGNTDIISDDADKGSTPTDALYMLDIDDFTFDASNQTFAWLWEGYYHAIFRANLAIENIPGIDMDPKLRDRLVGEAKFLRAYAYFNLVRWFGELPLITRPLEPSEFYTQTRQPVDAVYDKIEQDLLDALEVLPEKSDYPAGDLGRATLGAARGMLAKVYLTLGDYANCEKYCLEVIESNEYVLWPNYSEIFTRVGENCSESLFEIQSTALSTGSLVGASPFNMIQGVRGVPNLGWGFNRPSDNLVAEFEFLDPRLEATILSPGEPLPDGSAVVQDNAEILDERFNQKAWVPAHAGLQDNGPGNIRILRYSDVLLMMAEALNEQGRSGDALPYLNEVRTRARTPYPPQILPDVTTTDQTELRLKIWHERRVEFGMEQQRWFDLLRTGRAAERMAAVGKLNYVEGKHELLPLPQTEIDVSGGNLDQNPLYN